MLADNQFTFLLASNDPALLAAMEPVIAALGARAEIVLTAEAALADLTAFHPPVLALLDATLLDATLLDATLPDATLPDATLLDANPPDATQPDANMPHANLRSPAAGLNLDQLLTSVRTSVSARRLSIVLIADTVTQNTMSLLDQSLIDDVLLRTSEPNYWRLRLQSLLCAVHTARELETLREAVAVDAETDRLTGVYNRETLLRMLFRETDRVQRSQSSMCLLLFDIDDFGHWNSRLGPDICDNLLCQVAARTNRVLRSYDLFGRPGLDEFLIALPGCTQANALLMAERLRVDVFCQPFHVDGESIRLSACFGMAVSRGRSPVVVLREAEQALLEAKASGPESIQCFSDALHPAAAPVTFLSPSSGDQLLAW
jgi:two-component system, cell cycle response regulator